MTAIRYQRCAACGDAWALDRPRCRTCGADAPASHDSTGCGTVFSVTIQHRAPSRDHPEPLPWCITLVDLDDGPRIMGHADPDTAIGDRVAGRMQDFAGTPVPTFTTVKED
ncbi:Zn-ribbon domain-containing OB-fold protein [Loktanella sp. M215]|uniref:Zn-ribbon domain-containing OB-fold protein n=1 Tax=Loktanella sp. M215 TaxID=2675431 RepID=UPI001F2FDB7C|nr:DNA-binding protein [Loktanella sp. M215]